MSVVELAPRHLVAAAREAPAAMLPALADRFARDSDLFEAVYLLSADNRVVALGLPSGEKGLASSLLGLDLSRSTLVRELRARPAGADDAVIIWSDEYLSVLSGTKSVALGQRFGDQIAIVELAPRRLLRILLSHPPVQGQSLLLVDRKGVDVGGIDRRDLPALHLRHAAERMEHEDLDLRASRQRIDRRRRVFTIPIAPQVIGPQDVERDHQQVGVFVPGGRRPGRFGTGATAESGPGQQQRYGQGHPPDRRQCRTRPRHHFFAAPLAWES